MNILVTGGSGYLGSHLIHKFLNNNHKILCLILNGDLCANLDDIKEQINFLKTDDKDLKQKIKEFSPTVVVHTATAYERGNTTIEQVIEANLLFPLELLQTIKKDKSIKWINTSTGLAEDVNSYTLSKSQFEKWGKFFAERGEIQFIDLKLEHFYGKNGPDTHFLARMIRKLQNGETLELTAGTQHRDFVYIEDLLNIYSEIITKNIDDSFCEISIGTGVSPTIKEVIEYLHKITNSKSKILFGAVAMRKNEPDYVCDTSQMKKYDLKCKYYWKDGLKEII